MGCDEDASGRAVCSGQHPFNWAPERPLDMRVAEQATTFAPGYGRWRLEVEPAEPALTDHIIFLNVLRPSLEPSAAMPDLQRVETEEAYGAVVRSRQSGVPRDVLLIGGSPPRQWQRASAEWECSTSVGICCQQTLSESKC